MLSQDRRQPPDGAVVEAARAGDQQAMEQLVQGYLPLVYNIVGRALDGHADVDDVVQETMMRALDGLPGLRDPERFRSWLVAITVRQIRDHWRGRQARPRPGLPEAEVDAADPSADFADLTILRLALSGQRREAVEATRWLEDEEREVLSLWWLEAAGELTRNDLAAACELAPPHAAVRVQRVKERLESARTVVRALVASPRCADLSALVTPWDGRPSALWRKRLARHVRDCPQCLFSVSDLVPTEGLLARFALVPLPVGLAGPVLLKLIAAASGGGLASGLSGAHGGSSRAGHLLGRLAAKPLATVTTSALVLAGCGAVVYAATRPHPPARQHTAAVSAPTAVPVLPRPSGAPTPVASGTPAPVNAALPMGSHALRSVDQPGRYLSEAGVLGFLHPVGAGSPVGTRRQSTFTIVAGLADRHCYSFKDATGRYLRHFAFRARLDVNDGSAIFKKDTTFCVRTGSAIGSVSLESYNYPGRYLHHRANFELWLDPSDNTDAFRASSSFSAVAPWA
ncbi:RNA polymerase sigma factor (sigma-70 family) [Streptacidiphilus sp. MAP12-16]